MICCRSLANVTKFPGEIIISTTNEKEAIVLLVRLVAGKPESNQIGKVCYSENFKSDLALGNELGRVSFQLEELMSNQLVTRTLDVSLQQNLNAVCSLRLTRLDATRVWRENDLELYPNGPELLNHLIQQKIEDDKRLHQMQEKSKVQDQALDQIKTRLEELAYKKGDDYASTIENTVLNLKTSLDKQVAEASEQRKEENSDFTNLIASDSAAKDILGFAKNRLNKFYNPHS